ncbi:F-box protein At1g61340 [Brassica rapa]|uniref:F-box domain-containing protein n=1 Tax=Brassica campestris TaxID=3711 RepID=M4FBW1_BRACM|nr:F-box protein At1g61340 [Brassica rapa]
MALGKKRIIVVQKSHLKQRRGVEDGGLGLELELELVQYKRGFGRKRVLISSGDKICDSPVRKTSSKKLCDEASAAGGQSRELEYLPLDILTLIAKQSHFAYSTPWKTSVFERSRFGLDKPFGLGDGDDYEIEAPGAPLQKRYRSRDEDDSGVSVALFK